MKKITLLLVALSAQINSAQNTFPLTGNVGIGITTPEAKLHVYGDIYSTNSSNEGGAISLFNSSKLTSSTAQRWSIYNMTGLYGNSLQFWSY